jgi:hypothetical protein
MMAAAIAVSHAEASLKFFWQRLKVPFGVATRSQISGDFDLRDG